MLDSFFNSLFLKFWSGNKKVGPQRSVLLSKSYETYGSAVYDLKWTLKYIHANGKTSHSVTITERASKWNLKKVIHIIERRRLPREIEALIQTNTQKDTD
ncbi:MAG: hypothetical protein IKQ37_10545 [Bacteroidaceae bacterium]|nr:hypothetical protein [Bacteroidaceae bacterium]